MAYTKRTDIPIQPGETAVELDTGALVAVRCDRKGVDAGVSYHPQARAVDEAGVTLRDPLGRLIRTEFKHTLSVEKVDEHGDTAVTRECLFAVLGEATTVFAWSPELLTAASIRRAIDASAVAGPADPGAVL